MWHGQSGTARKRDGHPALGCLSSHLQKEGRPALSLLSPTPAPAASGCLSPAAVGTAVAPLLCHRLPPGSRPPHSAYYSQNTAHSSCFLCLGPLVTPVQSGVPISSVTPQFSLYPLESQFTTSYLQAPHHLPEVFSGLGLSTCDESNMSF